VAGAAGPNSAAGESADGRFQALEHEYVVYLLSRFPVVATYLGGAVLDASLAAIDGQLRDHSAPALVAEDARLAEFRQRFRAKDDPTLSARRRTYRQVALAQLEHLLHQHQTLRHQERCLDTYVDEPFRGVDWQIQGMTPTGADTYGTPAEWQRVIARTRAVPAYLAAAEKQLAAGVAARNTPDQRVLLQYGLHGTTADAEYFARTLPALADENLPADQRAAWHDEVKHAGEAAAAAYAHLRAFIVSTFYDDASRNGVSGIKPAFRADRYAAGEVEYDWALRNNLGLDTTAARLFDEAQPIIENTRGEMVALATEIAKGQGWPHADGLLTVRLVFDHVGKAAPRTDADMLQGYIETGRALVEYARTTGLFDVPTDYRLDVSITPPPLRSSIDGAAYYPAPPFKTSGVGRFYVTPTGDDPVMLRQEHNSAALADLAAHEGFPGHDWHYKIMSRYRDEISAVRWLTPGAV